MFEIMIGPHEAAGAPAEIAAEGDDDADLLRAFLGELLYKFSAAGTILSVDSVALAPGPRVTARCRARPFDAARDTLETELKAVTYHQLEVRREGESWIARVVFDV
jgi:SHS2 domain-containing protein